MSLVRWSVSIPVLLASCALAACSADGDSGGSGQSRSDATGAPGFDNATPADQGNTPTAPGGQDFGNPTGTAPSTDRPILNPGANVEPGSIKFSYIWIANTLEGTVSKLDTRTLEEVGRYLTSPTGTGLPSRTSVGPSGDVVVANRGGASNAPGGDGAGVIKVFADQADCVDLNANGTIETSQDATFMPWGTDECVAWFTPLDYFSNRPVAWAPAPSPDAPADVWTAGARVDSCPTADGSCNFEVVLLDGTTGMQKATIPVMTAPGMNMLGFLDAINLITKDYGPYGGAADSGGNFWTFTANTTYLVRVDAVTQEVRQWEVQPAGNGYGITIDENGNIHLCGSQGMSRFSPGTETWIAGTGPILGFNGCMTDGAGTIWVAGGADNGDPGIHSFDAETLTPTGSFPLGAVKGVSVDVDGFVWGVGSAGFLGLGVADQNTAWKLDPNTGDFWTYEGLNGAYSYSDMTGFGLESAGVQPPLE